MEPGVGGCEVGEPTAVEFALDGLATALDHLVKTVEDGGLDAHDQAGLVSVLQGFERVRNRMALVDHTLIADGARRGLPVALAQPSMQRVLTALLRVSPAEASRRVRAAEAVGPRTSMLGERLGPVRPRLAAVQRAGEVTPEQVGIVVGALDPVDRRGFDSADISAGEELLAEFAALFGPQDLRRLAQQVVDRIDPDGTRPAEELNADRRHFRIRHTPDGAYVGEFRLTGSAGAKLVALLDPLAKPRTGPQSSQDQDASGSGPVDDGDHGDAGSDTGVGVGADPRTRGQRWHDAVEDLCDRALRAGGLPDAGGTPATVVVLIDWQDLLARTGHATTSDGAMLSTGQVLDLARSADIIPVVLDRHGAVLDLGRSRRIASPAQTWALYARDGGCSFPGCAHPPEYCERHHIVAWADGGQTNLDNMTLLCRYHHGHFASRGWTCQINTDGLPEWVPPRWLDPAQTPIINTRIHANQVGRQHRLE